MHRLVLALLAFFMAATVLAGNHLTWSEDATVLGRHPRNPGLYLCRLDRDLIPSENEEVWASGRYGFLVGDSVSLRFVSLGTNYRCQIVGFSE